MKVNGIEETAHTPYYGPWSAWTPWQTICRRGFIVWQTRSRTREVGETWSRRTRNEDCFELPLFQLWQQVVSFGPWETVTQTSTATEREYRTISLIASVADWKKFTMVALPTLYTGDRLQIDWGFLADLSEVKAYSAALDGEAIDGDGLELGVYRADGHHTIDIDVETEDGNHRYQIAYSAAARIDAWFADPAVELKLPRKGGPNGAKLSVTVANRSPDTIFVRPSLEGVPAGWKAVFLDEQPTKLAGGREREFTMQVEAMTDAAIRSGPLPFTVVMRAIGKEQGTEESAFASCIVRLTGKPAEIAEVERASVARMRRHRPLVDVQ